MDALAKLSAATTALEQAKNLDEVKHIIDIAEAARVYARAAKLGLEAANHAAEVKLRAERKAGELLTALAEQSKPNPNGFNQHTEVRYQADNEPTPYRAALADTATPIATAQRWQTVAQVPDEVFEEHIAEVKNADAELTSAGILRKAQELQRQARAAEMRQAPELPKSKYRVWYADPPWQYGNAGVITDNDAYGRAARHYPSMSIAELCAMGADIKAACEPDAVLFMWVTSPLLEECFPVINAWGFKYKTSFVWDKVGHNFGHYNSVRHELLLVCTRGSCTPDDPTLHDSVVSIEKSRVHSQKPDEFRAMIDSLYTWGKRIELFARAATDGWDTWGNQSC